MNIMLSSKHRPFSLADMVGQKGVRAEMKTRSVDGDFSPVMLFEGPPGTGKTTLAYIIAATMMCSSPVKSVDKHKLEFLSPCGKCVSCIDILEQRFSRDIIFSDASNMGKDGINQLKKVVDMQPMFDDIKIIIIDEAQELSKAGKGAALTLLEMKRENVYFILCTMDPDALPKSGGIRRRTSVYKFKPVGKQEIAERLFNILKMEEIVNIVPEIFITAGLFTIANYAEGDVATAIQCMDRCIKGGFYDEKTIVEEFGFITDQSIIDLISKMLKLDSSFFKDITQHDIKQFFFVSWKILTDIFRYHITSVVDAKWKERQYKALGKESNLPGLIKVYQEIYQRVYYSNLNTSFFTSHILLYYENNKVPVRRKRVKVND